MNSTDPRELSERFADAIGSLFGQVYAELINEWQKHGITMLQARILDALLRQGPARTTELATRTSHNLSGASELVNRLVNKDMVRLHENPNDRGEMICELTARGQQVAVEINSRPDGDTGANRGRGYTGRRGPDDSRPGRTVPASDDRKIEPKSRSQAYRPALHRPDNQ